jgi:mannose-6-phosphate isomerase-like protein (cupin superfamily)
MTDHTAARPAGRRIRTFRYQKPHQQASPWAIVSLCETDAVRAAAHVLARGEVDNLHLNVDVDELWMVLAGRARFLGPGRTLIGEFAIGDGILVPRETRYRIENIGDVDLELIQLMLLDHPGAGERIDLDEPFVAPEDIERHDGSVL